MEAMQAMEPMGGGEGRPAPHEISGNSGNRPGFFWKGRGLTELGEGVFVDELDGLVVFAEDEDAAVGGELSGEAAGRRRGLEGDLAGLEIDGAGELGDDGEGAAGGEFEEALELGVDGGVGDDGLDDEGEGVAARCGAQEAAGEEVKPGGAGFIDDPGGALVGLEHAEDVARGRGGGNDRDLIGGARAGRLGHEFIPMPRRARIEQRYLNDQDPIGIQRAERKELESMASEKKIEAGALTKMERKLKLEAKEEGVGERPERVARPGKPLKRRGAR